MQEKLIILRNRHNYSIKYVSEYLGISTKQYSEKEKGRFEFTSDEMFLLKDLFGCGIEDIFLPRKHHNGDKNTKGEKIK